MTTVNITIILGFSTKKEKKSDNAKKEKKEGKEKKDKHAGDEKEPTKGKEKKTKEKKLTPEIDVSRKRTSTKPKNYFEVGAPKKFAHIEYQLLPDRPFFKVDVNCWGDFAKIYCEDDARTIRTIQQNDVAWVPVKVKHFFKRLKKEELFELQTHVIKILIWTRLETLDIQAKSEKASSFYIFDEHLENNDIVEAFEKAPGEEKPYHNYLKEEQFNTELRLFKKCAFRGDLKSSYLAFLNYFPDETHDYLIKKIIQDVSDGVPVKCTEFVRVWVATSDEHILQRDVSESKENQKSKGGKKKKGKVKENEEKKGGSSGVRVINVSGEVFFTEPNLSTHRLAKSDREICAGYVLLSVRNLMTRSQKNEMNPLVINIKKIVKLPVEILEKQGFQFVKALYNAPKIAQCITTKKPLSETIHINESHVFFLQKSPLVTLYEFFYCKQFVIEIIGMRRAMKKISKEKPLLFGGETTDKNFSKRLQSSECSKDSQKDELREVTLAVACYDISTLLQYSWCFNTESQCANPETSMNTKTSDPLRFTDIINAPELNLDTFKDTTNSSCLTDDVLLDFGTSVAIEMFLQAPQNSFLACNTLSFVYQRLVIITSNEMLAANLLNQILLHNQKFLPEVITANYLKTGMKVVLDPETSEIYFATSVTENKEVLSGFLIDNVGSYIFFVEGTPVGLITTLWRQVMNLPTSVAHTQFNTKQVFAKRLYEEFLPFGGFYTVTLQTSLKNIMSQTHIYLKGNAPLPCWEALKRIDLLLRSKNLKSMAQWNLFPSAKQLLSLDVEFGVPLRWKKPRALSTTEVRLNEDD